MLTQTTVSAIRALIHLGLHGGGAPVSPRRLAEALGESPTYLAKVMRLMVRAGLLRAHFGAAGGVVLDRDPASITLLAITQACQGAILANLCTETDDLAETCAFHQAGAELHQAILGVMSRWTLADFLRRPSPSPGCQDRVRCWMTMDRIGSNALDVSGDGRAAKRKAVALKAKPKPKPGKLKSKRPGASGRGAPPRRGQAP